jgi:hypothetical protein
MKVSWKVSSRLDRLLFTIQKYVAKEYMEVGYGKFGNLARLVFGKATAILEDLHDMLEPDTWADEFSFLRVNAPSDMTPVAVEAMVRDVAEVIRVIVTKVISGYVRRVTSRLGGDPYALLWIAYKLPTEACPKRLELAARLLATPDCMLHQTARKCKHQFSVELGFIVETGGKCPTNLYIILRYVCEVWCADTKQIEGLW